MLPDYAFRRREIGRVVAVCPNYEWCNFEGKVEEAVVRKYNVFRYIIIRLFVRVMNSTVLHCIYRVNPG